jgi:hypothetical protein
MQSQEKSEFFQSKLPYLQLQYHKAKYRCVDFAKIYSKSCFEQAGSFPPAFGKGIRDYTILFKKKSRVSRVPKKGTNLHQTTFP